MIKEYEASHGTVADMWEAHLRGEDTSLNPLGMVEALVGAMSHAESLNPPADGTMPITDFASRIRQTIHTCMVEGQGTRDLCGPEGLTTEQFVEVVAKRLAGDETFCIAAPSKDRPMSRSGDIMPPSGEPSEAVKALFTEVRRYFPLTPGVFSCDSGKLRADSSVKYGAVRPGRGRCHLP